MTTYTIELPDRCPHCKKNVTAYDNRRGSEGFYAELVDRTSDNRFGPVPHRAPLMILAGTEREEVTVFAVCCADCYQEKNAKLMRAAKIAGPLLAAAREINEDFDG